MKELQDAVHAFHRATGYDDRWDQRVVGLADEKLRAALIMEEAAETVAAILGIDGKALHESWRHSVVLAQNAAVKQWPPADLPGDFPAAVDGLCDLMYVIVGAALRWGVDLGPLFAEVHRANMAKAGGPVREDGKRLKPPGWTPPDIEGELRKQGWNG